MITSPECYPTLFRFLFIFSSCSFPFWYFLWLDFLVCSFVCSGARPFPSNQLNTALIFQIDDDVFCLFVRFFAPHFGYTVSSVKESIKRNCRFVAIQVKSSAYFTIKTMTHFHNIHEIVRYNKTQNYSGARKKATTMKKHNDK